LKKKNSERSHGSCRLFYHFIVLYTSFLKLHDLKNLEKLIKLVFNIIYY